MTQFDTCQLKNSDIISQNFNNIDLTIKYKRLFILNNQLLTYIYFPLDKINALHLNYYTDFKLNNIIGYTGLRTSSTQPIIIKYNYDIFEFDKCSSNKSQCFIEHNNFNEYFLQNKFNLLFSQQELDLGYLWRTILDDMYIEIEIGAGGKGGGKSSPLVEESDNDNSRTCPGNGGNTIINFGINNRYYKWDDTIIARGGKIKQQNNDKLIITTSLLNRIIHNYFNKGSKHLFYDKMNICGGGGGGCFSQLELINKDYNNPFMPDIGNIYNKVNLDIFGNSQQIYLYQDSSNKLKTSKRFISDPRIKGGDGGTVNFTNKYSFQGRNAISFGCGGGGGAKRNTSSDFTIGGGGAGKMGAIIILNSIFDEVYNSTTDPFITSDSLTKKIYLKDILTRKNTRQELLDVGKVFYIISIGGGAGGMSGLVTGAGGNGGNLVISRHLYEQPFTTSTRNQPPIPHIFSKFIDNWNRNETNYYQTNVNKVIKQTLLNNYVNKCNDSLCSISKISKDNEIDNFININKKNYFGFLHISA